MSCPCRVQPRAIVGWLMINFVVALGVTMWLTLYPTEPVADVLNLAILPSLKYRAFFIGVAFIQFALSYVVEKFLIDNETLRRRVSNCLKGCLPSQDLAYHKIESEIEKDPNWPPVSKKKVDLAEIFQRQENMHSPQNLEEIKNSLEDVLSSDQEDENDQNEQLIQKETSFSDLASGSHRNSKRLRHDSAADNVVFSDYGDNYNTPL